MTTTRSGSPGNQSPRKRKPRLGKGLSSLLADGTPVRAGAVSGVQSVQDPDSIDDTGEGRDQSSLGDPSVAPSAVDDVADDEVEARRQSGGGGGTSRRGAAATPDDPRPRGEAIRRLSVASIEPSPFQPRGDIDESSLEGLARSLRESGVIQPLLVRPGADPDRYELIAGERRWRAAKLAGLADVPAIVRSTQDAEAAQLALVENVQREDLNAIERSDALVRLSDRFGWTQKQLAEKVGLERSTVANLMRLSELEPAIRSMVAGGDLSFGHAKALLACPGGEARVEAARRAADEGWSVRKLESSARDTNMSAGRSSDARGASTRGAGGKSPDLADLERRLGEHLGSRVSVSVSGGGTRGRISVEFFDLDHFDAVLARMGYSAAQHS